MSNTDDGNALVTTIKGLAANDGGDRFFAPRNLIAFAVVGLFAFEIMAPYYFKVPETGQALNLIISTGKTVETVLVLVLGFFFGTTVGGQKKDDTIRQQALQAPSPVPAADPSLNLQIDPPAKLIIKDPTDDPDPNAGRGPDPASSPAQPSGVQARDGGPAE